MKIHTVIIENLNSLYGRHQVDFVADLDDAPLFLVVGPTGAGKSTIMDAISLALFGMTPRLSDGHGQADTDSRMIMSRGTGRCSAEVVFSKQAGGARDYFRARWEAWRSRDQPNGAFQTPRRSLIQEHALGLDDEVLANSTKKKEWAPAFATVLEGMEPSEFQRSMLLAQGQFAAFLRATVAERAQILERLTSTEEYRHIGARAMERFRVAKSRVDTLRAGVEAIDLLDALQLEELRRQADVAAVEVVAAENRFRRARALLDWKKRHAALTNDLADASEALRKERQHWDNQTLNRERLAESNRCAAAGEILRRKKALALDRIRATGALDAAKERHEEQVAAMADATNAVKQAAIERTTREEAETAAQPRLTAAVVAGEKIRAARALEHTASEQTAAANAVRVRTVAARATIAELISSAENEDAMAKTLGDADEEARNALATACSGGTPAERTEALRALREQAASRGARLETIRVLLEAAEQGRADADIAREKHEALVAASAELGRRTALAAESVQQAEEKRSLAQKLFDTTARVLDLWDRRAELTVGEPCPLCGATEHPFAAHDETSHKARAAHVEATEELRRVDEELEGVRQALRDTEVAASTHQARVESAVEEHARAEERAARLRAELLKRGSGDGVSDRASLERLTTEAAETVARLKTEERAFTALRESADRAASALTTFREGRARREQELTAARAGLTEMEDTLRARDLEAAEAKQRLTAGADAAREATRTVCDHVPDDALLDELDQALLDAFDGRTPDEERTTLAAATSRAAQTATETGSALAKLESDRAATAAVIEDRSAALALIRTKVERTDAELAAAIDELGFGDPAELGAKVLTPDERDLLQQNVDDVRVRFDQATGRADTLSGQLKQHTEAKPPGLVEDRSFESLELDEQEAAAAMENRRKEHAQMLARLDENERLGSKQRDLIAGLTEAEEDAALWNEMRQLIGSNEGGAFQRFAQTLNLAELVGRANLRLRELEPRYELVVAQDADGVPELAFAVRDHELGGRIRPQTTLSGGETFLVSLALALALSEYRQTQMPIETLLLDEGFGTLDAETLDVAMSALERLCATGGTQIGVISHVEGLRERINAQIVLEKLGGGRSRLSTRI